MITSSSRLRSYWCKIPLCIVPPGYAEYPACLYRTALSGEGKPSKEEPSSQIYIDQFYAIDEKVDGLLSGADDYMAKVCYVLHLVRKPADDVMPVAV